MCLINSVREAVGIGVSFSQKTVANKGLGKGGKPGQVFIVEKLLKTNLLSITGTYV